MRRPGPWLALTAIVAGGAMAAVAWLLSGLTPFLAAPVAVLAYGGVLYALGGLDAEQAGMIREIIARKTRRRA